MTNRLRTMVTCEKDVPFQSQLQKKPSEANLSVLKYRFKKRESNFFPPPPSISKPGLFVSSFKLLPPFLLLLFLKSNPFDTLLR